MVKINIEILLYRKEYTQKVYTERIKTEKNKAKNTPCTIIAEDTTNFIMIADLQEFV